MPFYHVPLSVVLTLLHWFVWRRVVRPSMAPGPRRRAVAVLLVVGDAFMVATLLATTRLPREWSALYSWPGYIWFGLFFYFIIVVLVAELPRFALRWWVRKDPRPADANGPGISRRTFVARSVGAVAGVTALGAVGYGMPVALGDPEIKNVRIRLPRLDPRASGCRIALISDLHLGALLGRSFTERVVELVNSTRPDLVAVAGDLVDGRVEHLAEAAEPLRDLRSTHGSFFVTGNHEYYYQYEQWVDHVRTLGITTLLNEHTTIEHNGGRFELGGLIDPNSTVEGIEPGPDLPKTLDGWDRERAFVLLSHQPAPIDEVAAEGVDLQLSGHTHGGQLAPFNLLVKALEGSIAGLSRHGDTQLYITRGAGFWGPPVRVGAPPDITVVEIVS
ncbi:metallophosphoesterase [Actinophytocola gossypii]|uniref:Metallophosphoesterase n=1 Tax=Actinophytocola gossypii TaxID=2812003 RepID=A0ABT2J794_9PSEU|nr:metallophosphoesterase [Actinophytocola gossypii]MCT2583722.1 metallophosphoesterase [Actinophytocola gossypii]